MKKTPRQFRLSSALDAQVRRVAAGSDISTSAVIRVLLTEALRQRGMWPASADTHAHVVETGNAATRHG